MICSKFYGGLHIINNSDSTSLGIVNGLVFEMQENTASITADIRASTTGTVLHDYATNLEFALVAAEARLNFLLSTKTESPKMKNYICFMQK